MCKLSIGGVKDTISKKDCDVDVQRDDYSLYSIISTVNTQRRPLTVIEFNSRQL